MAVPERSISKLFTILPFTEERRQVREDWNLINNCSWQEYLAMREAGTVFYSVESNDGYELATGCNCTNLEDVRSGLTSLFGYTSKVSLKDILLMNDLTLNASGEEFEENYD